MLRMGSSGQANLELSEREDKEAKSAGLSPGQRGTWDLDSEQILLWGWRGMQLKPNGTGCP